MGGLTAVPAGAAGAQFVAVVSTPQVTLLPQSSGAQALQYHSVGVSVMAEQAPLSGVQVAVDASRVAGVAGLSLPGNCRFTDAARLHAACSLGSVDGVGQVEVGLRSLPGAKVAAKGSVRFTVTAANATEDPSSPPTTTTVVVGDGPDLAVLPLPTTLSLTPGGTLTVNPQVANVGDRDASGITLLLDSVEGGAWSVGGGFGNCRYGADAGLGAPTAVVCHFNTVVKPGETYQLATPAPVSAVSQAPDGVLMYGWDVTGGQIDSSITGGTPGHGAPLALVPVPASARHALPNVAPDINYDNNVAVSQLHLVSADDVAAVAHDVTGTVGRKVTTVFGVRNDGTVPTRQVPGAPGGTTAALLAMLPQGVSVVSAPKGCQAESLDGPPPVAALARVRAQAAGDGVPGAVYACLVTRALQPGAEADFAFTLKPTRTLHAAQGTVVAVGQPDDNTPLDNIATFQVTATPAAGTPSASASPVAHPSASATAAATAPAAPTGPGGSLAHTGGGDDTLPLVGAGLAAVVLGGAALALTRRRRGGTAGGSHS
ncbi:LPXTG cell wall anchor domain-containing protein [Streptacidiphilus fuscans]|uniref:LPXTG cell wall anchor domain-containing protein n=1 Tax=Streptacidiphilus fuscans TaxID=2789292 RepID=UPI0018ACCC9F|nr:LPXTG cell wall anchor domain-containing protein [Streptacidiphilus fuscans]